MHACMREACMVCVRSWICTYVRARACHMYAWNCDVCVCVCMCVCVMCLIVQVFSFFIVLKYKKIGKWLFYNFLTSWHPYWQFIRMQNKVHDKCAHLHVITDDRQGIMLCSSVFQGTQSASLGLLWTILFGQDDLLSLSLSLSLSMSLSPRLSLHVSLSPCLPLFLLPLPLPLSLSLSLSSPFLPPLSLSISLSLSLSLSLCLSLSLSLSLSLCLSVSLSLSFSLSHSLKFCLSIPHLPLVLSSRIDICLHVRINTCQNCFSRTAKQLQAHHGRA